MSAAGGSVFRWLTAGAIDDLIEFPPFRIGKVLLAFGAAVSGPVRFGKALAFRAFPGFARLSQVDDIGHATRLARLRADDHASGQFVEHLLAVNLADLLAMLEAAMAVIALNGGAG